MITLAAPAPALQSLWSDLRHERLESAAILLCTPVRLNDSGGWRLILREAHVPPPDAYEVRTETSVRLSPEFGLPIEKKARQNHWSLVYCHTHPAQRGTVGFSDIDDASEIALGHYASSRSPGVPHLALVFSVDRLAARLLGTQEPVRVIEVGATIDLLHDPAIMTEAPEAFDRQVRAFGIDGQRRLQAQRVAIVGAGGTGSIIAEQLAHLGVSDFVLADRDNLEVTNLNRTVGATLGDVGKPKVAVAERMIRSVSADARILALTADVVDEGVSRRVAEADVIFCCTDSQASRHILNQVAYQYLVPMIDLGVAIDARKEPKFAGHVKALAPGLACLWCIGNLDPRQVREQIMSPEHRQADPYFLEGHGQPQPAVISLNGTVASLAVTMFLAMVAGVPSPPRYIIYDGNRARVSSVVAAPDPECNFCSTASTALSGDAFPLPERRRAKG